MIDKPVEELKSNSKEDDFLCNIANVSVTEEVDLAYILNPKIKQEVSAILHNYSPTNVTKSTEVSLKIILSDDVIDKLENTKVFSCLDLKNGFFHVPVDPSSTKFTPFELMTGNKMRNVEDLRIASILREEFQANMMKER